MSKVQGRSKFCSPFVAISKNLGHTFYFFGLPSKNHFRQLGMSPEMPLDFSFCELKRNRSHVLSSQFHYLHLCSEKHQKPNLGTKQFLPNHFVLLLPAVEIQIFKNFVYLRVETKIWFRSSG